MEDGDDDGTKTSRRSGARSDANERRDSCENCGVVGLRAGIGGGTAAASALSWSARRRNNVSREPDRARFRCARRRCKTSVERSA